MVRESRPPSGLSIGGTSFPDDEDEDRWGDVGEDSSPGGVDDTHDTSSAYYTPHHETTFKRSRNNKAFSTPNNNPLFVDGYGDDDADGDGDLPPPPPPPPPPQAGAPVFDGLLLAGLPPVPTALSSSSSRRPNPADDMQQVSTPSTSAAPAMGWAAHFNEFEHNNNNNSPSDAWGEVATEADDYVSDGETDVDDDDEPPVVEQISPLIPAYSMRFAVADRVSIEKEKGEGTRLVVPTHFYTCIL